MVGRMPDRHRRAVQQPLRELVAESGYSREATYQACVERDVVPTLAWRALNNRHCGFDRERFTYLPGRDTFICPAGHEMRHSSENLRFRQSVYRTVKGTCHRCPLKSSCSPGRAERSITRRWEAVLWEDVERHLQTRHARQLLRRRKTVVEPIIADAKIKHGMVRAQFRGREKMQIQALLTAATLNLKQLVRATRSSVRSGGAGRHSLHQSSLHRARPVPPCELQQARSRPTAPNRGFRTGLILGRSQAEPNTPSATASPRATRPDNDRRCVSLKCLR
jgi:Transposase DDE domain